SPFITLTSRIYISFLYDTPTTTTYTLSLHDALPIWAEGVGRRRHAVMNGAGPVREGQRPSLIVADRHQRIVRPTLVDRRQVQQVDRKSTRLNSSHVKISYAVFCLKKKKKSVRNIIIK